MVHLTRRALLRASAAGVAIGLAGCSSSCPDRDSPEPDRTTSVGDEPTGPFDTDPGGSWPAPRYDPANTGSQSGISPPSDSIGVRWRTALGSGIDVRPTASSPTVAGGTVYVTDDSGLHALSLRDGSVRWQNRTVSPGTMDPTVGYDDERVPPVVGPDGTVYVGGTDALTAIDPADGSIRWQFDDASGFGAPTVVDDRVFVGAGRDVVAVTTDDATLRWTDGPFDPTPNLVAFADDTLVVSTRSTTSGFTVQGGERWSREFGAEYYPVVADGTVYLGGYEGLSGISLADGTDQWTFQRGSGRSFTAPVVTPDSVYAVEQPGEGPHATFALDRTDGAPSARWCSYVGEGAVAAAAGDLAFALQSPPGGPDRVADVGLVAFTDRFGEALWGVESTRTYDRFRPPAVLDGAVIIVDPRGTVAALGEVDG